MSETELIRREEPEAEMTISQLAGRMEKIREVMKSVMHANEDYGVIPGTQKPALLQPGAEKLAMLFRFAPTYQIERIELAGGHREYFVTCRLTHSPSGNLVGEATASCSSMEPKYRYRGGSIACPTCGAAAVIKGKKEYGGGWVCFKKKGGCGAKFPDAQFSEAQLGKQENPDIAAEFNTICQMAQKRAFLRAIRTATAASELFTQDIEEQLHEHPEEHHDSEPAQRPAPQLSRDFEILRQGLYDMGVPQGNTEQADAVIHFCVPGATIRQCAKDDAMCRRVLDELTAKSAVSGSAPVYQEAMEAAGLAVVA